TLLLVTAPNAINATLYDKLNFNFMRDIAPVAGITREANVMALHPSVPAKTVPEFIAYTGKINMASAGNGSAPHVSGEWRRPRIDRFTRWTGAGHVPLHVFIDRVHQGRQSPPASGDHRDTCGGGAGHSDCERIRPGLRGERLLRPWRAQKRTC